MSRNPYLFIVGCARSGTTLLQRMLDHNPLLAVANEARFMLRLADGGTEENDPPLTPEMVEWVRAYHRFPELGISESVVSAAAATARTYGEFASALYSEFGKLYGKALVGEKTPRYVGFLSRLHTVFPWVKTIHLIRDGRDVALSTLQWAREGKGPGKYQLWLEEPVAVCALWWQRNVSIGRASGVDLGSKRYQEVKYEDLVNEPEETLRRITGFLELPFSPQMLAYHEGKTRHRAGLSTKKAWLPPTPGLRDWRTQMSGRDIELFEALAGDLLSMLGYERAFQAISPEIAEVAERCRDWWDAARMRRSFERASALSSSRTRYSDSAC
jgi:sulfotransferase family protein